MHGFSHWGYLREDAPRSSAKGDDHLRNFTQGLVRGRGADAALRRDPVRDGAPADLPVRHGQPVARHRPVEPEQPENLRLVQLQPCDPRINLLWPVALADAESAGVDRTIGGVSSRDTGWMIV